MKTHWLQNPNKNYLGHWDLPDGKDLVLTIDTAKWEDVKNPINNKTEKKRVIRFKEKVKPFICNQTNAASILKSTGMKFMEESTGQKIQLYIGSIVDKITKENIDCIRIRQIKPELPELFQADEVNWNNVKKALLNGYTIDQIKTRWKISAENQELLISEIS